MSNEPKPQSYRIIPHYSPVSGAITSFTVEDPEGVGLSKWRQYVDDIHKKFPKVHMPDIEAAEPSYHNYRVLFVLPAKQATKEESERWWTIYNGQRSLAVDFQWEAPKTEVARFWEIYHATEQVPDPEQIAEIKKDVLAQAESEQLVFKPAKLTNIDRYFYALYQVSSPKLLKWFYKTFFQAA